MTPDEAEAKAREITDTDDWFYDEDTVDRDKLAGLIAAAILEAAGQWNADMDAAPRDGTWVVLRGGETTEDDYCDEVGDGVRRSVVAAWKEKRWAICYWDGGWRDSYENPTHWRHLPEPP